MCWVRVHLDAQALTGVHQIKAASGSKTKMRLPWAGPYRLFG